LSPEFFQATGELGARWSTFCDTLESACYNYLSNLNPPVGALYEAADLFCGTDFMHSTDLGNFVPVMAMFLLSNWSESGRGTHRAAITIGRRIGPDDSNLRWRDPLLQWFPFDKTMYTAENQPPDGVASLFPPTAPVYAGKSFWLRRGSSFFLGERRWSP
jgi:hypothetical protein